MTRPGEARVRAVLFDRDGTLVHDVPYNRDPDLVEPVDGAREVVQEIVDEYELDPNFPSSVMDNALRFLNDDAVRQDTAIYRKLFAEIRLAATLLRDNSPYPEVRAGMYHTAHGASWPPAVPLLISASRLSLVVANTDDPSIPCSTLRAWVIGPSPRRLLSFP